MAFMVVCPFVLKMIRLAQCLLTHTHTVLALAFRLFFLVEGASPSMVVLLLSGPLIGWLLLDEKTLHRHRLTAKISPPCPDLLYFASVVNYCLRRRSL